MVCGAGSRGGVEVIFCSIAFHTALAALICAKETKPGKTTFHLQEKRHLGNSSRVGAKFNFTAGGVEQADSGRQLIVHQSRAEQSRVLPVNKKRTGAADRRRDTNNNPSTVLIGGLSHRVLTEICHLQSCHTPGRCSSAATSRGHSLQPKNKLTLPPFPPASRPCTTLQRCSYDLEIFKSTIPPSNQSSRPPTHAERHSLTL